MHCRMRDIVAQLGLPVLFPDVLAIYMTYMRRFAYASSVSWSAVFVSFLLFRVRLYSR